MARTLKLEVVAEGVEDDSHLQILRQQGCHRAQGFLFSKPVPERELEALLRTGILDGQTSSS